MGGLMAVTPKLSPTQFYALERCRDFPYHEVPARRPFNWTTVRVLRRLGLIALESGTQTVSYAPSRPNAIIGRHSSSERITYAHITDAGRAALEANI